MTGLNAGDLEELAGLIYFWYYRHHPAPQSRGQEQAMTETGGLAAFILARLDEDEAAAAAAAAGDGRFGGRPHWSAAGYGMVADAEDQDWGVIDLGPCIDDDAVAVHVARFDPARVLRDVAAKRAILDRHMPHQPAFGGPACNWCSEDVDDRPQVARMWWPCPDVRSIAAVWSDHPDFDPAWAPLGLT